MLPIPTKLVKPGVRDMLRISDAPSGTSYGACVLHVSPESYVGGNLALVQTGDLHFCFASRNDLSCCDATKCPLSRIMDDIAAAQPRAQLFQLWSIRCHRS